ncbi:MAG: DUF58 domain-containing protein [Planctomycetes bacterium]|nr:DUF58 domain-containing protein [Planctomycetota bacterium]
MATTETGPRATSGSELFDAAFLRSLEGLRFVARRVPAGGRIAEQRSRSRGGGVEFTDVRPYVPGDDFRAIDWHLLQRLDRVFLRLFLEEEDLPVHIVLDESASMGQPPAGRREPADKTVTALRVVAALAYVASHRLDRVTIHPFAGEPRRPLPGISGRVAFRRLLAWLGQRPAAGEGTGLVRALKSLATPSARRGLCIVVSDFLDPAGAEAVVHALRTVRHDLLLVRIAHPGEERPALSGEVEIVDSESGESLALHVDDALLSRYAAAHRAFEAALADTARARRGGFLSVRTDRPIVPQLVRLFREGNYHT